MIKAVIFDVDGVLIDSFEANLQFFKDLMNLAGYKSPTREEYVLLFPKSLDGVLRTLLPDAKEREIKRVWDLGASRTVRHSLDLIKVPENMAEVIEKLSQKYLLGLVTSRIKNYVFEVPKLKALEKYFKVVVAFEDTVNHKPHPEPLFLAVKKFGIQPDEAIYIGDAPTDVQAAHAAGMRVITYPKPLEGANGSASVFAELPPLLETLE